MRIALLTDFGTRDPYVASMRGVLTTRTGAPLFDLTHEIEPFDVFGAAWFLRTVVPWWPATIFISVVDPGVGTGRKIVGAARGDQLFLAPDNGLLTMVLGEGDWTAVSVENDALFLPRSSTTFHGRDRFAPVAAALANGTPLSDLGPPLLELERLDYSPPSYGCAPVSGTIVRIDRFGNCITDVEAGRVVFPRFAVHAGGRVIARSSQTYAGEGVFFIVGSTGHLELSLAGGSAAEALQVQRGDRVSVAPV